MLVLDPSEAWGEISPEGEACQTPSATLQMWEGRAAVPDFQISIETFLQFCVPGVIQHFKTYIKV